MTNSVSQPVPNSNDPFDLTPVDASEADDNIYTIRIKEGVAATFDLATVIGAGGFGFGNSIWHQDSLYVYEGFALNFTGVTGVFALYGAVPTDEPLELSFDYTTHYGAEPVPMTLKVIVEDVNDAPLIDAPTVGLLRGTQFEVDPDLLGVNSLSAIDFGDGLRLAYDGVRGDVSDLSTYTSSFELLDYIDGALVSVGSLPLGENTATPFEVVVEDVDGDGDGDLIPAGFVSPGSLWTPSPYWWENDDGTFRGHAANEVATLSGPADYTGVIGISDSNGGLEVTIRSMNIEYGEYTDTVVGNIAEPVGVTGYAYSASGGSFDLFGDSALEFIAVEEGAYTQNYGADANGEGTGRYAQSAILIAEVDSSGVTVTDTLLMPQHYFTPGQLVFEVADLDGDGLKDLIVAENDAGWNPEKNLVWFKNNGDKTFGEARVIDQSIGWVAFNSPLVADIDQDGDNDIVLYSGGPGALRTYENDGYGNFQRAEIDMDPANPGYALDVGYLPGEDGAPGMIVTGGSGYTMAAELLRDDTDKIILGAYEAAAPLTVEDGKTLTFTEENGNAIRVSDPENEADLRVTLTASTGSTLSIGVDPAMLEVGTGSGDTTITLAAASPSVINAALQTLSMTVAGVEGAASLTILAEEVRSDGVAPLSTTVTVEIGVTDPVPTTAAVDDAFTVFSDEASGDIDLNVIANDTNPRDVALAIEQSDGWEPGTALVGSNGGRFTIAANGDVDFDANGDFDALTAGESATTSIDYRLAFSDPGSVIDVVLAQDLSSGLGADLANIVTAFPEAAAALAQIYDAQFALTSFIDAPSEAPGDDDYVFRTDLAVTDDLSALASALTGLGLGSGGDSPESQLDALLQIALRADTEIGFREGAERIVMLASDALYHQAGDRPDLAPNNGDALIEAEDYASVAQVREALEAADIIPLFVVSADVAEAYEQLAAELGRGHVVPLADDSTDFKDVAVNAVQSIRGTSTATITATVNGINDAPTISEIAPQTVAEDATLEGLAFTIGDPDTPLDQLTVAATSSDPSILPETGIALSGSGPDWTLDLTPAPDASGRTDVTVTVFDGEKTTSETFELVVAPVVDAPLAKIDNYGLVEDTTLTVAADKGVLANDIGDEAGSPLSAQLVNGPQHGTVDLNADGSFSYRPDYNFNGLDRFTYKAEGEDGVASEATEVRLLIEPAREPQPVAVADRFAIDFFEEENTFNIFDNDGIAEGAVAAGAVRVVRFWATSQGGSADAGGTITTREGAEITLSEDGELTFKLNGTTPSDFSNLSLNYRIENEEGRHSQTGIEFDFNDAFA